MFNSFKNDSDRGFTLAELMMVIIIIGIVAAIASPTFVSLISRNRLNGSLQQLLGAIKETQRQAILQGKLCKINIYPNTKNITASSVGCSLSKRNINDEIIIRTNIPGKIPSISFSYKGSTTRMGTIVLSSNNTNFQKCFVIALGTGITRTGNYNGNKNGSVSSKNCQTIE